MEDREEIDLRRQLSRLVAECWLWRKFYADCKAMPEGQHTPPPELAGELSPITQGKALDLPAPERGFHETRTVEEIYAEFWMPIVQHADGTLDRDAVARELADYAMFLEFGPLVYDHVTDNMASKINIHPEIICELADERVNKLVDEELAELGVKTTTEEAETEGLG